MTQCGLSAILLLSCAGYARSEEPLFSGPQPGEVLPSLKATLAYGEKRRKTVDLIKQAAGKPTLLVIVNGSNRPAARLSRVLMNFAEMRGEKLFAAVVYLDKDMTSALEGLKRAASWWKVGPPVGVSVDGAEGPGSYGLNRNVNVTVLIAEKGRVKSNFALVQPSERDAAKILKDVVGLAGGRVPTEAEVMFLSVPTYKPDNVRWRSAPSDVTLRRLLCDALASKDEDAAREAATAVEKYVGSDGDKGASLGNAAAALLERKGRVAIPRDLPIVSHLRRWRKRYDNQDASRNPDKRRSR
jgi:hypothetical protein